MPMSLDFRNLRVTTSPAADPGALPAHVSPYDFHNMYASSRSFEESPPLPRSAPSASASDSLSVSTMSSAGGSSLGSSSTSTTTTTTCTLRANPLEVSGKSPVPGNW